MFVFNEQANFLAAALEQLLIQQGFRLLNQSLERPRPDLTTVSPGAV
jgi:hypothetical protein